jgi:hypothetical protein
MGWGHLKIFFSRTTGPILTRLRTNHPWWEGIQVCTHEGDCPSPRGDNSKRVKIHRNFLKIFFSRTSRPTSIKLGRNYPRVKRIQVCTNKGTGPLQRRDNHKKAKMGWGHLKIFSKTTGPILTKFDTIHPWWEGIQVCTHEGDCLTPRGDNSKRVKNKPNFFLKSPPEPAGQNQSNKEQVVRNVNLID